MIQTQAVESMADAHRRELMARRARGGRPPRMPTRAGGATQRSATGLPVTGGRAVRRAVAPRLGAG